MLEREIQFQVTMKNFVAIVSLALSVQLCLCSSTNLTTTTPTISALNEKNNEVSDYADMPLTSSSTANKQKPTFSTGNELWDGLIRDCLKKPTFSCIQKNVYTFLDSTLKLRDVNVTSKVQLTRNQLDYELPQAPKDEENEIFFEGRASPIEEVSNALYDKGVKFLVTHNMDVKLPEIMFDGATFRVSPRSIEGNGIIAKLEYIPKQEIEARASPSDLARLFKKKIKKFFKRKAVLAVLAVVLIIKLIKIKLFWLLPLLVGVGTAKKLLLKFVLFLFPALGGIFKLCGLYHANHHKTNYHHHKHNINHLHTVLYDGHEHEDHHHPIKDHIKDHFSAKPYKGHASEYLHSAPVPPHLSYFNPDDDWTHSGPGLGSEFISGIIDRKSIDNFKPKLKDAQEIVQWGLPHPYHGKKPSGSPHNALPPTSHSINLNPLTHNRNRPPKPQPPKKSYISSPHSNYGTPLGPPLSYGTPLAPPLTYGTAQAPHISYGPPSAPQTHFEPPTAQQSSFGVPQSAYGVPHNTYGHPEQRLAASASQYHPQIVGPPIDENLIKAQHHEAMRIQKEHQLIAKQQSILSQQPFVTDVEPLTPKLVDQFYSPILTKLDQIFLQLGYTDEPCRERLVCNMYKQPTNYSPHSNYVSAELSRETSELQRPLKTNAAVMRFYKYVNAARDGQEQHDCHSIYPCNLPTKK